MVQNVSVSLDAPATQIQDVTILTNVPGTYLSTRTALVPSELLVSIYLVACSANVLPAPKVTRTRTVASEQPYARVTTSVPLGLLVTLEAEGLVSIPARLPSADPTRTAFRKDTPPFVNVNLVSPEILWIWTKDA